FLMLSGVQSIYNTHRQTLLLAQFTYCVKNAKSQLFVINADYVLRE
ncbi:hypothetical protein HMPREF1585_00121, partial [Gardnerella vaginalis JCP8481B]